MSTLSNRGFSPFLLFLASSSLLVSVLRARPRQTEPSPDFREELIAEVTPGNEYKSAVVGDNHLLWVENQGGKRVVRLDGKQQGNIYDDVKYAAFNSDESHYVFFAKRNSIWVLVFDGQERPEEYSRITALSFQPRGQSYSFCACKEKSCHLIVDGRQTGDQYSDISAPTYSHDGQRLAFFGKKSKKWVAVVDSKEMGPELEEVWFARWGFSRDGNHFYNAGRAGSNWTYLIDGTPNPDYDVLSPLVFSSDGAHYAYGGVHVHGGFTKQKTIADVISDGRTVATYEGKGALGSWTLLSGTAVTVIKGVHPLNPDFHGVSTPAFDSLGRLIYIAHRDSGDNAVFVAGQPGPGFDEILSPIAVSEDSKHLIYVARQGNSFVEVRDNVPGKSFTSGRQQATDVDWISTNPDGTHMAFETVSGGTEFQSGTTTRALRSVVVDGKMGTEYDALGIGAFRFGNDPRHYFYAVYGAKGNRDRAVVDGHESKLYDFVVGGHFVEDGQTATFVARDSEKFLRVTITAE